MGKLMDAMSDPLNTDQISWLPDGKVFAILNRNKFIGDVLPKYFGAKSKYLHFKTQLKKWGFIQLKSSTREIYFHKYFQRDHRLLCSKMRIASPKSKFQVAFRKENMKGRVSATLRGYLNTLEKPVHIIDPSFNFPSTLTSFHSINKNTSAQNGAKNAVSRIIKVDRYASLGLFKMIKTGIR